MGIGTSTIATGGRMVRVSADGSPEWKVGGVTIDWADVTAVSADETLKDGTVVLAGDKYLRYGTVLTLKGVAEVQAIDLSAGDDPTAGTWTITVPAFENNVGGTTSALAYNVSAADVQAALELIVGEGLVTVAKVGFVYTITFNRQLGVIPAMTVGSGSLTGATSVTVTESTAGVGNGYYGPYASGATDGRQTLTRGRCYILDKTIVKSEMHALQVSAFDGGLVYLQRILDISTNPTESNLFTAFPRLRPVPD